jgi:hypothetical protein
LLPFCYSSLCGRWLTVHHPREAHCWLPHRAGAPHAGGLSGNALCPSTGGVVVGEGGSDAGRAASSVVNRWLAVHPMPRRWLRRLTPVLFALVNTVARCCALRPAAPAQPCGRGCGYGVRRAACRCGQLWTRLGTDASSAQVARPVERPQPVDERGSGRSPAGPGTADRPTSLPVPPAPWNRLVLPLPPTALHAAYLAEHKITPGSEFDPKPGQPLTHADRASLARRDAARAVGAPVPPVAARTTAGTARRSRAQAPGATDRRTQRRGVARRPRLPVRRHPHQPEDWFLTNGDSALRVKAVCGRCTVRQQCLDYALRTHQPWGVWGGLTSVERGTAYAVRIQRR